jgi:signal transduction histidine kinase
VTDEEGLFLFYEGTVQDITLQRESEDAMRNALTETQEAARGKAAFLAAMSHELKTPLNAIVGFSDLMRQELFGPLSEPRYRSYVGDIHENGLGLLRIINDILDLSRIESGLLDVEFGAVCVQQAITAAWDAVGRDSSKNSTILVDVPSAFQLLSADGKRLHQVLVHLLSNAANSHPMMLPFMFALGSRMRNGSSSRSPTPG